MDPILNISEAVWDNMTGLSKLQTLREYNFKEAYYNNESSKTHYIFILKEELIEKEFQRKCNEYY